MSTEKKLKKMMRNKALEGKLGKYLEGRFDYVSYLFKEGFKPDEILPELTTSEIYFLLTGASDYGAELKKVGSAKMREELSQRKEDGKAVLGEFAKRTLIPYHTYIKVTGHFTDYNQLRKHMLTFLEGWLPRDKNALKGLKQWKEENIKREWLHGAWSCPDNPPISTALYIPDKNCCIRLVATDYKTPESTYKKVARQAVSNIMEANKKRLKGKDFEKYVFNGSMIQDVLRSRVILTDKEGMEDELVHFFMNDLRGFRVYDIQHREAPQYKVPLCRMVLSIPDKITTNEGIITPRDHLICQQIMTPHGEYRDRFVEDHGLYNTHRMWEPFQSDKTNLIKYRAFVENAHNFLEA